MLNVFSYTDYRKFLDDAHREKKAANPRFSYRMLARIVACDPAHITRVLRGKTNISLDFALKIAEALKLTKRQSEFFQALVLYNQAQLHEEKRKNFERLLSFKESSIRVVSADQYEFYDKWYYPAVRAVLGYYPFQGDFQELASLIVPAITPEEARKAIELLKRLSLIRKTPQGPYEPCESLVKNDPGAFSVEINNFVLTSLELARQSIDRFPREERMLSTTTLTLSRETYEKVKEEIRDLRIRVMAMARRDALPERSFNLNFQLFPISRLRERKTTRTATLSDPGRETR